MDDQLFTLIGRLYVEVLNSQKVIELLQNNLQKMESQEIDNDNIDE